MAQKHDVDRVAVPSLNADGSADQTKGYDAIDEKVAKESVEDRRDQQAVSATEQAQLREARAAVDAGVPPGLVEHQDSGLNTAVDIAANVGPQPAPASEPEPAPEPSGEGSGGSSS